MKDCVPSMRRNMCKIVVYTLGSRKADSKMLSINDLLSQPLLKELIKLCTAQSWRQKHYSKEIRIHSR